MRCDEKTHSELSLDPSRKGFAVGVRDTGEVLPLLGRHCHTRVGDHAKVVLPNQEALDAIDMA
jgi:hypothetical protein